MNNYVNPYYGCTNQQGFFDNAQNQAALFQAPQDNIYQESWFFRSSFPSKWKKENVIAIALLFPHPSPFQLHLQLLLRPCLGTTGEKYAIFF